VKHLSGVSLKVMLLALTANIKPGWKDLPGANDVAYFASSMTRQNKPKHFTLASLSRMV
jgi:hypothetical protein